MLRRVAVPLLVPGLGLLLAASATPAATAERAGERAPASVTITGKGWGHGKGLSQYGARNRANDGQRYASILKFYYPGTKLATTGGSIRVLLTADTTNDVRVLARTGLRLHSLGAKKTWRLPAKYRGKTITTWRIRPASGNRSLVQHHAGAWRNWRTPKGAAEFAADGPITLATPAGRASYRGRLRSSSANASGSSRDTVNVLSMEAYLRGVVAREMPAEWPAAAVQAQAVAARTYAAFERRDHGTRYYDLCDTTQCQVYGGYRSEDPGSDAAIRATARKVVTYAGRPAFTQFSASNGGFSAAGDFPYLRARKDTADRGYPGDPWVRNFTGPQVTRHWPGLGDLVSVTVDQRDASGRAKQVTVTGTSSSVTVPGSTFASYLGLRSTKFSVS